MNTKLHLVDWPMLIFFIRLVVCYFGCVFSFHFKRLTQTLFFIFFFSFLFFLFSFFLFLFSSSFFLPSFKFMCETIKC